MRKARPRASKSTRARGKVAPDMPKSVVLLGREYKILYQKMPDHLGYLNYDLGTITISPDQSAEDQVSTLFHECLHGIFAEAGWSEVLGEKMEEALVRVLENGMRGLFKLELPK